MTVDIISLAIVGLLVFLGWRSGALRQILRVVAIVAVVVGVPFVSPVIREVIFGETGRASPGIEVGSIIGAGVLIYVTVALAGWVVVKVMRMVTPTIGLMDRFGGAAIGGLKAVIIVYLCAVLVVLMEGPIDEYDPDNELAIQGGHLTTFVADYNVLAPWQFPDLNRLHRALRVGDRAQDSGAYDVIREHANAADLLRDDRIEELLSDEALMQWVRDDHYPMTLADGRIRQLLNDDQVMEQLEAVDWRRLSGQLDAADESS